MIGTQTRLSAGQSHPNSKKIRFVPHRKQCLPYKDQQVNAASGQRALCIVGIICNALHGHSAERMDANADGKYTYHRLRL